MQATHQSAAQRISRVLLHHAVCVTMVVDFWVTYIQTINQTKIDVVEWALNELTAEPVDKNLLAERFAALNKRR
tara:strand:- start:283 stop:504 length:222 start_codon:yes stop_codon:yes gene_type:complete